MRRQVRLGDGGAAVIGNGVSDKFHRQGRVEQDSRLAKFQQTYVGKLPGAEASNINMLTTLNTQLDAATQALTRMEQNKQYAESLMSIQQQNQAS